MWTTVTDLWGSTPTTWGSAEELARAIEGAGYPPPVLVEHGGILRVRIYQDEGGTVYEGDPRWRREAWLARGANWLTVAVEG